MKISTRASATSIVALTLCTALVLPGVSIAASPAPTNLSTNAGATRHDPAGDASSSVAEAIKAADAKNVILLIGDGMGDSEITVARNYEYGAAGELPGIDALPLTGQYTTYSLYREGDTKGKPDYVPDSAATGSAWATGTKTYDNAVSVDIDQVPQPTILEIAKANGLKTGNVTTSEIQDATPAVLVAHVDARSCYGPDSPTCGNDALTEGGLGSISEQLIGTRPDVTLGGGSTSFEQTAKAGPWEGQTLFDQAAERGYQVIGDSAGLASVTTASQQEPVLGLFTPGNFPTRYTATAATVGGADLPPVTCQPNPERLASELSLGSLTTNAISLLDNDEGFFLQVEGASIDKRDHAADACGQIGETVDFDEAVQAALAFAEKDENTLVLVTADHAHSSQIVDSTPPTSLSTALATADGTIMKVSYGTAEAGESQQHTGSQLRIAGYGPGAANIVGLTDQTDTFFTMANALKLDRNTAAFSDNARLGVDRRIEPGATVSITAEQFNGDRQVTGAVTPGETTIDAADVVDGAATLSFTAPTEPGKYTVTVTGAQSGTQVTAKFMVK
ncbi:alkaline phosphatase [Glaciihabitans tibetensis]|uniref:Alkaline phosphatase n=1 Tax=Glaciihabitans tibetensis TaxID=1266600 RepID=A0A2T0VFI5_9MICO|nr:alkaline phosphatase [Glaciihabitans tibetensis]PRY68961.1 alkaline phosphatase [Glaciihabitans tibetensis]